MAETLGPVLCLAMIVAVCGLLMAGFPVAPTLAGTALLFALGGAAFGVFDLSFLIGFPQSVFATMTSTSRTTTTMVMTATLITSYWDGCPNAAASNSQSILRAPSAHAFAHHSPASSAGSKTGPS